ncbi:MAG: hypothetical protein ACKOEC_13945 [Acidimicrobiia bacterium]
MDQIHRWKFVPTARVAAVWWLVVFVILQLVDLVTGPYYQLPSTYVLPVIAAAWFSGLEAGIALAVALPLGRVFFMYQVWNEPWEPAAFVATAATRIAVFVVVAVAADRLANHERALEREVKQLVSLLPVCADCHKIRDRDGAWTTLEAYAALRTAEFQPGLCIDCARSRLPEHVAPAGHDSDGE